jgi:hypothetical protein
MLYQLSYTPTGTPPKYDFGGNPMPPREVASEARGRKVQWSTGRWIEVR